MRQQIRVKDITQLIEELAPLSLQESYDNAGLICGDFSAEITSVLLTTDITEEVIEEAIQEKQDLIISHHPLTLQGFKNLLPDSYIKRCLLKAIRHNLNIYSSHTNLDAVAQGVSNKMADKLGLIHRQILQPNGKLFCLTFYTPEKQAEEVRTAVFNCGAGYIGNYSHCSFNTPGKGTYLAHEGAQPFAGQTGTLHTEKEIKTEITVPEYLLPRCIDTLIKTHPYEEPVWNVVCLNNTNPCTGFGILGNLPVPAESLSFLQQVKAIFGSKAIRHTAICKKEIRKVAVCGGSGAFLTRTAIARNADIFITGDYKYHDFFNAEGQLILADIGHYESEQFTKEIFYELVTKKFPNFAVQFSKVLTNPVYYL